MEETINIARLTKLTIIDDVKDVIRQIASQTKLITPQRRTRRLRAQIRFPFRLSPK
jgi:hypothetical protein